MAPPVLLSPGGRGPRTTPLASSREKKRAQGIRDGGQWTLTPKYCFRNCRQPTGGLLWQPARLLLVLLQLRANLLLQMLQQDGPLMSLLARSLQTGQRPPMAPLMGLPLKRSSH